MGAKFSNVRGTSDFNISEGTRFSSINQKARATLDTFGYREIILPLLEEQGLFAKGVGATSDIVQGQIFKIEDKDIVLRPEGTAQVIRYYIQNALHKQSDFYKFFYRGPMFRGERPQKGRLRQFHHIGAEAIGSNSFYIDVEMIVLMLEILKSVGITTSQLHINTLGCKSDKDAFSAHLQDALAGKKADLCENCTRRLRVNPLRVLDCKKQQCRQIVSALKLKNTHICASCMDEFIAIRTMLEKLGYAYNYNPYLVRGLDYYTNTVFEVTSSELGAKDAIGAGGRYNNLVKFLGGPDIPAIGFALGVERMLLLLEGDAVESKLDVFVAITGQDLMQAGFELLGSLRRAGLRSDCDYSQKSLKGQLRLAQRKGARYVVIVGDEEWKNGKVVLKNMEQATQEIVALKELMKMLSAKGQ